MQKDKQEMTTNDNYLYEHEITTDDDDKRKLHTCFHPPQFRRGWFWRRHKKASRRSKFTPLIFFEWHFYIPSRPQSSRRSRPGGRPPQKHRRRLRKRDGTAAAAFLVPLAVEISHENFIIRSSKAEQGAAPLSLETFPNYYQKFSDL